MSRRTLPSALRSWSRQTPPASRLATPCQKQFSSTANNAIRAVFTETSNVELNKVLGSIQNQIILPAYLPEKQRKIVFDAKKRSYLEQNPIIIEVDGLEHKFSSIDRFKGVENSKKALSKALNNMQTAEDWANLGTLLAGYKKAGIRLKAEHWGKIARLAGTQGHVFTIIECAKQSDRTGFSLKHPEVVTRILACINDRICENAGNAVHAKQALKWAELVLDLLQRPEHIDNALHTRERLHFSRLVRGMVLFTRASSVRAGNASEQDVDRLRDEVSLIISLWNDQVGKDLLGITDFATLNPAVERNTEHGRSTVKTALSGSAYVQVVSQNIRGIEIAKEVLVEVANSLSPVLKNLKAHLQDYAAKSPSRTKSWAEEYRKVLGEEPSWPPLAVPTTKA